MYWQDKYVAENTLNASRFDVTGAPLYPAFNADHYVRRARYMQSKDVSKMVKGFFKTLSRMSNVFADRVKARRAYANLIHADPRLLEDIGLDRAQLRTAVVGEPRDSLLAQLVKAAKEAHEAQTKVYTPATVAAAPSASNDDHRLAA